MFNFGGSHDKERVFSPSHTPQPPLFHSIHPSPLPSILYILPSKLMWSYLGLSEDVDHPTSLLLEWIKLKRQIITGVDKDADQLETIYNGTIDIKWNHHFGKPFGSLFKCWINLIGSSHCTLRYLFKDNENISIQKLVGIFIVALFVITKKLDTVQVSISRCIHEKGIFI